MGVLKGCPADRRAGLNPHSTPARRVPEVAAGELRAGEVVYLCPPTAALFAAFERLVHRWRLFEIDDADLLLAELRLAVADEAGRPVLRDLTPEQAGALLRTVGNALANRITRAACEAYLADYKRRVHRPTVWACVYKSAADHTPGGGDAPEPVS